MIQSSEGKNIYIKEQKWKETATDHWVPCEDETSSRGWGRRKESVKLRFSESIEGTSGVTRKIWVKFREAGLACRTRSSILMEGGRAAGVPGGAWRRTTVWTPGRPSAGNGRTERDKKLSYWGKNKIILCYWEDTERSYVTEDTQRSYVNEDTDRSYVAEGTERTYVTERTQRDVM